MKPLDPSLVRVTPEIKREDKPRMPGLARVQVPAKDKSLTHAAVIALDPGGTTGWSLFVVDPEGMSTLPAHRGERVLDNVRTWNHGQVDCGSTKGNLGTSDHEGISTDGENAGVNELIGLVRAWPAAAVIIEDFIIDPERMNTDRDFLAPVRLTAPLSYMLWLQKRTYFVQSASLAKATATDERLRGWGYYSSTGGMQHARDADRHALTFLKRCANPNPKGAEMRMAAWPHLFGKDGPYHNPGRVKDDVPNQ